MYNKLKRSRDAALFSSVHVSFDTIAWANGADICPETLHRDSVPAEAEDEVEVLQ